MTSDTNPHANRAGAASLPTTDWSRKPLRELIEHIVEQHHEYLREEMPAIEDRLELMTVKLGADVRGTLVPLLDVFTGMKNELDDHMRKEEMILFPFIERMEHSVEEGVPAAPPPFGTVRTPIQTMLIDHDSTFDALKQMRHLTNGYTLPGEDREAHEELYKGLEELESDLRIHIHLENDILFPRAQALESDAIR
ncbi:MAG: hemerythrin domain-containing protein [Bryobacterales bacterium]|nr:hemerythrin domain-containing protein [Bryobacterales bacterium]